jgi:hypothetical protein
VLEHAPEHLSGPTHRERRGHPRRELPELTRRHDPEDEPPPSLTGERAQRLDSVATVRKQLQVVNRDHDTRSGGTNLLASGQLLGAPAVDLGLCDASREMS